MMSLTRFNMIHSGMTAVAKKVYAAVPIAEQWPASKIMAEMSRLGYGIDYRTAEGCLRSLVDSGLVREPKKGEFKREGIREDAPKNKEVEPMKKKNENAQAPAAKGNPIDQLEVLAQRAVDIATLAKDLASDISDAAIYIQEQVESNDSDLQKLKQLQTLLKGVIA